MKTSGSKGLHIYVRLLPQWDSYEVRAAAVAAARELERRHPDLVTAKWWKEERGTRVFVDFNQNAPHKTVFGAWCARPRTGAQVSTPLEWDDVDTVTNDELTVLTVPARLAERGDAWAEMDDDPQTIEPLLEMSAARHGGRPDGRAVAARVPQAAQRTAPRQPQPGPAGKLKDGAVGFR